MKILQSAICRAIAAIVIGALLIKYPDNTVTGITIAIGVIFLLSGLLSCLSYWNARRHSTDYTIYDADGNQIAGPTPTPPIVGIGSVVLGLILALMPNTFVSLLMYFIGAVLVLGAINQFMSLINIRRIATVPWAFWVAPSLILLCGLYIILKPMAPAETAMLILGWLSLFYGVVELINMLKISSVHRRLKRIEQEKASATDAEAGEAEAIEVTDEQ